MPARQPTTGSAPAQASGLGGPGGAHGQYPPESSTSRIHVGEREGVSGGRDAAPPCSLLISVFALEEVAAALAGGADIVDVKNPAEGALGAPTPELLRAVRSRVAPPVRLSAALGDAPNLPGTMALAAAGAAACGADYLKIGLLGASRPQDALALLVAVRRAATELNPQARLMAVAYADACRVGGLPPAELPCVAREAGVHGVMLDTAIKDGSSSWAALGEARTAAFFAAARSQGLATALAGGLGPADVESACRIGVDIVGFRGSACEGGRGGTVSAARVRALRAALAHP